MPKVEPHIQAKIINPGFLSEEETADAIAGAAALCQPSTNESFSIVLFEAWNNGVPVLVHGECDVTIEHCRKLNGGLWFNNYDEFKECLDFFAEKAETAQRLTPKAGSMQGSNIHGMLSSRGCKKLLKISEVLPMHEVHQIVETANPGDAITNFAIYIQERLKGAGFESRLFAANTNSTLADKVLPDRTFFVI